jgi:hypothetical protein
MIATANGHGTITTTDKKLGANWGNVENIRILPILLFKLNA